MNIDDIVTRACHIPGQTWARELAWLHENIKGSMRHAEIGVFCGRSLYASCVGMQSGATAVAVDLDASEFCLMPEADWMRKVRAATLESIFSSAPGIAVEYRGEGSLVVAREMRKAGLLFDSVFIDGDHSHDSVSADIESWLPLLRRGGLICGHDYSAAFPGVVDAVNEWCGTGFEVVPNTRLWWARVPTT